MEKKNLDRSFTHLPKFDLNSSVSSALPFKPFLNGQTRKVLLMLVERADLPKDLFIGRCKNEFVYINMIIKFFLENE